MFGKFRALWKILLGNRFLYVSSVTAMAFATFFSLLGPLVIRATIDSVIGNKPLAAPTWIRSLVYDLGGRSDLASNLWISGIALLLLTIANGSFLYLRGRWSAFAAENTAKNLRDRLYDHLQRLPYEYHVKAETGDLIQRCTSDLETIRRFLATQFVEIGRGIFMVAFAAVIMFSLDVKLAAISMTAIPFVFGFAVVFFVRIRRAFKLSDESEGRLSTTLQENLTGVRVVRAFARQRYEIDKFEGKNVEFRDLTFRLIQMLAVYWASSDLICLIQIGTVLVLGGYLAANGVITLGTMVVFFTYIGRLLWPVRQMGRILTEMGKTSVSIDRINAILDELEELDRGRKLKPAIAGRVVFENVSFSYDGKNAVVNNLSFTAEPGQTVAILGPTGSGKSTMMHLLPRLYDYSAGRITIDGIDIRDIDMHWIREQVGIVLQEPFLFNKTLKQNISLARENAAEDQISNAVTMSALRDVIAGFEKGFETPVGEGGVTLSGGQKQRVAIARALVKDPPVLIFDDSLSAVDTETDTHIRQALAKRHRRATTFIISHRVTTLADADKILVIENGRIVQEGTHSELLDQEGLYRRVWEIQSALEAELVRESGDARQDGRDSTRTE
jgi:ATP-binding cassette subfamily B protein